MSNNSKNFLVKKGLDVTTGLINNVNINDLNAQSASDGYVLTATSSGTFAWEPFTEAQISDLGDYVTVTRFITASGTLQMQIDSIQQLSGGHITASGVTYENLDSNGDIGTGSAQVAAGDHNHLGIYEPADPTILKDVDIGLNVQAYDDNIVSDSSYVHTDNNYTTVEKNKLSGIENGAEVNTINIDDLSTLSGTLQTQIVNHVISDGTDHVYIDQDVTSSGSPTFSEITVNNIQLDGADTEEGFITWDNYRNTASLTMGGGVVQQIGEEVYYTKATYNDTGSLIPNGTPVGLIGRVTTKSYIGPAIGDATFNPVNFLGLATEDIADGEYGRVTYFGRVYDIDLTSSGVAESGVNITQGDLLYISGTEAGKLTNVRPETPNNIMFVGNCLEGGTNGRVTIRNHYYQNAVEVNYNNSLSGLVASNVQSAINELEETKASINMLSSNITMFPTSAVGDFGYYRMVTSVDDTDYDTISVDMGTGDITQKIKLFLVLSQILGYL